MRDYFLIDGYPISFKDNLAEFRQYKVLIRCVAAEFTYDWVMKMHYKLSVLKGII